MCGGTIICRSTRKETLDNRVGKATYVHCVSVKSYNNKHSAQTMYVSIKHICCIAGNIGEQFIGTNW